MKKKSNKNSINPNTSTKKRYKVLQTGIKGLGLLIIGAIIVYSIIAPYVHIFLSKESVIKYFGFRNLRNFFYAFGLPCSLFVCAILLLSSSKYQEKKHNIILYKSSSLLFLCSSFFQFYWIFYPANDLPKVTYYFTILVFSILSTIFYYFFIYKRKSYLSKVQNALNELSRFSFIGAKEFVPEDKQESYDDELLIALKKGMK